MRLSLTVIFIILLIVFLFGGVVWKQKLVSVIERFTNIRLRADADALRIENALLKDQIAALSVASSTYAVTSENASTRRVNIYASYPFNNQNIVSVDGGIEQGIQPMMPVTIGGRILVGQVTKTFKNYSLVRTLLSPDWQVAVRIGQHKVPGLLIGGPTVRAAMIANDKKISVGDVVIAASHDMPYGLKIGTIESVHPDTAAGVFQEARVHFDYTLNDLTELTILLWTPE